ncbi:unnamed protein product [Prorocentrum cordatum]|uniref:Mannosyltransferase n=1 Tax=Prorocentrum cordatum TaxID=2364126 RepID=A0ABN9VHS6_9DINO|nr:unnamed protein product [Polarella glacialis]
METRRTVSCTPIVASTRQGTSSAFSRQAKRLQWEMRWQQYRAAVLAVLLVVWAIGLAVLREHAFGYLAATSAVVPPSKEDARVRCSFAGPSWGLFIRGNDRGG